MGLFTSLYLSVCLSVYSSWDFFISFCLLFLLLLLLYALLPLSLSVSLSLSLSLSLSFYYYFFLFLCLSSSSISLLHDCCLAFVVIHSFTAPPSNKARIQKS